MELVEQHAKQIMEGCKERARDAGLRFEDETLEYVVTNRDLIELGPKVMIPTLYDYWVHDVELLREKGKYELYPHNPYETVINTRPAISFYNDNNPDWLNVMIFYHVLAHIDFFQNNLYFRHTWDYDFTAQALSDKRAIATLRSEHGRWVDYVIEFGRAIDNLVGYHRELSRLHSQPITDGSPRLDYYFDVFLQRERKVPITAYIKEIQRYNACCADSGAQGEHVFFREVERKHPEFRALFEKYRREKPLRPLDLTEFLIERSPFLNQEENRWMQTVLGVVHKTSFYFQPQVRTKIMNEGWASYWHETLFLQDDRIKGHEVDFARVNAAVTAMPRVGLNPYALGMRLFYFLEDSANRGRYEREFLRVLDAEQRRKFDLATGTGRDFIFQVRENFDDFLFINTFIEQDFVDRHKLFVAGRRLDQQRMVWQWYVKSRAADKYRQMVLDQLYHPPYVTIDTEKADKGVLYLDHHFEGKPLVKEYIHNVLLGLEYLWGGKVQLETTEVKEIKSPAQQPAQQPTLPGMAPTPSEDAEPEIKWQRVRYTMKDRKLSKGLL
jgi:stage V sporulation protein R